VEVYDELDHGGRRVFQDDTFGGVGGRYNRLIPRRGKLFLKTFFNML